MKGIQSCAAQVDAAETSLNSKVFEGAQNHVHDLFNCLNVNDGQCSRVPENNNWQKNGLIKTNMGSLKGSVSAPALLLPAADI